jgi:hypothetical protein
MSGKMICPAHGVKETDDSDGHESCDYRPFLVSETREKQGLSAHSAILHKPDHGRDGCCCTTNRQRLEIPP